MRLCLSSGVFKTPADIEGIFLKDDETSVTASQLMDSSQINRAKDVSNLSSRPILKGRIHQGEFINQFPRASS